MTLLFWSVGFILLTIGQSQQANPAVLQSQTVFTSSFSSNAAIRDAQMRARLRTRCGSLITCIEDLRSLRACKARTLQLERSHHDNAGRHANVTQELRNKCDHSLATLRHQHQAHVAILQNTCIHNITQAQNFNSPKLTTISKSLQTFNNQLRGCFDQVSNKTKLIQLHKNQLQTCVKEARQNVTQCKSEHDSVKQFLSRQLHDKRKELNRYIGLSHKTARNMSELAVKHTECVHSLEISRTQLEHWQTRVRKCNLAFNIHHKNITYLNNTLELYTKLLQVWKAKDSDCSKNLMYCHNSQAAPSDLKRLRVANEKLLTLHSDCLISKTGLLTNMSQCQSRIITHNERIHNLTTEHTHAKLALKTYILKHKHCQSDLVTTLAKHHTCNKTLIDRSNDFLTLEEKYNQLQLENTQLKSELNKTDKLLQKFDRDLQELKVINESAKMTIDTLLDNEKAFHATILSLERKYLGMVNLTENLFLKNQFLKSNLTLCLNKSTRTFANITTEHQIQTYLNSTLWDTTKAVMECVKGVANTAKLPKPSLNLLKVLMVSTNEIFNTNKVYNTYNSLAICNDRLQYCRTASLKLKMKCLMNLNLIPDPKKTTAYTLTTPNSIELKSTPAAIAFTEVILSPSTTIEPQHVAQISTTTSSPTFTTETLQEEKKSNMLP